MTAKSYCRLAALIFAVVAAFQLIRAVSGWPITVGATTWIPLWASWVVCVIGGVLSWIGLDASR
jgi:putative Mn2+ efflux pump MntP